jgi:hypothetical protein
LNDKPFFISRHEPGQIKGEWHLIQVDDDETNEKAAKQTGEYHIGYFIRQETDVKQKKIRECKHWPLLRELYTGGYLGPIIQIRPTKVETHLERNQTTIIWYQDTIDLFDLKLVGPFNFQNNTKIVPHESWRDLITAGSAAEVDTTNINRTSPLPTFNPRKRRRT